MLVGGPSIDIALYAAGYRPDLLKSLFISEPGFPSYVQDADALAALATDAEVMFHPVFAAVSACDQTAGVRELINGSGQRAGYFESQPDVTITLTISDTAFSSLVRLIGMFLRLRRRNIPVLYLREKRCISFFS